MKNILLFTIATFLSCSLTAQHYTFSIIEEMYVPLTNATELTINANWDDADAQEVTLPFPISIFNTGPITKVLIDSNFDLVFYTGTSFFIYKSGDYDFVYREGCSVSYKIEGIMPNRIFKIEYKDVGFWEAITTDFFSGQIWLHETGCISTHFGPNQTMGNDYIDVGEFSIFAIDQNIYGVAAGTSQNYYYHEITIADLYTINPDSITLRVKPTINSVFKFCPTPFSSVNEIGAKNEVFVYPNPSTDFVTVESKQGKMLNRIDIVSIEGKVCKTEIKIAHNQMKLDLSTLSKGIYILQTHFMDGSMSVNKISRQ